MRQQRALLAAVLVAVTLVATVPTSATGVPFVRTFVTADQVGTPGDDTTNDVSGAVTVGTVAGALPGRTALGGLDAYVRDYDTRLEDGLVPYDTYQIGGSGDDRATAVAAYYQGFLVGGVTTGEVFGPHLGGDDAWVAAYDDFDGLTWSLQFGGSGDDAVRDVAAGGGYYVAGHEGDAGFVRKYDRDGNVVWDGDVAADDVTQVLYTPRRLLVVEQDANTATTGIPTYRLTAFDPLSGDRFWRTKPRAGVASDIAIDTKNIYVTGVVGSPSDGFVTARDVEGGLRWSMHVFDGLRLDSTEDAVTAAAWDSRSLVVTVDDSRHDSDTLMAISGKGDRLWIKRMPDGMTTTSMSYLGGPLLVGGSTDRALQGENAGGDDAVATLFATYQTDVGGYYYNPESHDGGVYTYGPHQRLAVPIGRRGQEVYLFAGNEGEVAQKVRFTGCRDHDGYRFKYLRFGDITADVTHDGYVTEELGAFGETIYPSVKISRGRHPARRTTCGLVVSSTVTGERDRLELIVTRR